MLTTNQINHINYTKSLPDKFIGEITINKINVLTSYCGGIKLRQKYINHKFNLLTFLPTYPFDNAFICEICCCYCDYSTSDILHQNFKRYHANCYQLTQINVSALKNIIINNNIVKLYSNKNTVFIIENESITPYRLYYVGNIMDESFRDWYKIYNNLRSCGSRFTTSRHCVLCCNYDKDCISWGIYSACNDCVRDCEQYFIGVIIKYMILCYELPNIDVCRYTVIMLLLSY